LRDVAVGEIRCNGDNCCHRECDGNHELLCVTRDPATLNATYREVGCDSIVLPEWFYANDCFILPDPLYSHATFDESLGQWVLGAFVNCFCGRTASSYSGEYSWAGLFLHQGCGVPPVWDGGSAGEDVEQWGAVCATNHTCNDCQPQCTGRSCGPNGCGGNCGSCTLDQTCNAAGSCVSKSSSGDTCSGCLSTCHGVQGCCTGCGCLCEAECGDCF
jgi:hypothetical protein